MLLLAIAIVSINGTYATTEDGNLSYNESTNLTTNNTTTTDTSDTDTNNATNPDQSQLSNSPSNGNMAAGEPSTTFTIDQIKQAATTVRNYIETYDKLPDNVLIGTNTVTMPQFLELLTTATIRINNGNTNPIPLRNFTAPTSPIENIVAGNIYKTEYLKIANDIKNYMDTSGKTPDFAYKTSLGTYLRYENLVYMYSMILDYYNTSGNKAAFAAMKPITIINLPVLDTFTINQIKQAATTVRNYIENNQKLPDNVLIGTNTVTMPQFLELLTTATIRINNGNTNPIPLRNFTAPTSPIENIVAGNIYKTEYLKIANAVKNYMDSTGKTPNYVSPTSIGTQLRYENLVYMYSMILDYYNTSGNKAAFAAMNPWCVTCNPVLGTVTINQIKQAATTVRNYIETYDKLPDNVLIGTNTVTMPQFLELLTTATIRINNGNTNPIPLRNFTAPTSPIENIVAGNIYKTEYLKIANDIKNYMDTSGKTPDFAYKTSLGTYLRYENLVYMYSMILDYYNTSGNKAAFAAMKPITIINLPVLDTFTINQIKQAATTVRNYIETYDKLPDNVLIGTNTVTMPQFLELLTTATIRINNGNTNPIPLRNFTAPTSPIENIVAGNIYKTEYLKIANDIKNYMDTSRKTPDFAYKTSLGTYLRYENLVYMYSMILDYYNTSGNKAAFAAMKPWARSVYLTSDRIGTTVEEDWARIEGIRSILSSWGISVVGWGVGPDTQNGVLRDTSVPKNALIVDIYGGACAGTIYAMAQSYYLGIKGARKVFSIWTTEVGGWDIRNLPTKALNNGVNFLPRAHDDTFSTSLPDHGYNSAGVYTDGLNNPDQFLINHGYNFLVTSGNILEMATAILHQART
ncbi:MULTISPECIES: pseudomurein-binding repeat-containing protein [Methanobacterium]|nr:MULTISPECIES: pseudomurein-binding repeat-containing protein [Methanobacterium]